MVLGRSAPQYSIGNDSTRAFRVFSVHSSDSPTVFFPRLAGERVGGSRTLRHSMGAADALDAPAFPEQSREHLCAQGKLRAHLLLSPGAGVTPAEGSVKPTAGFTFN